MKLNERGCIVGSFTCFMFQSLKKCSCTVIVNYRHASEYSNRSLGDSGPIPFMGWNSCCWSVRDLFRSSIGSFVLSARTWFCVDNRRGQRESNSGIPFIRSALAAPLRSFWSPVVWEESFVQWRHYPSLAPVTSDFKERGLSWSRALIGTHRCWALWFPGDNRREVQMYQEWNAWYVSSVRSSSIDTTYVWLKPFFPSTMDHFFFVLWMGKIYYGNIFHCMHYLERKSVP